MEQNQKTLSDKKSLKKRTKKTKSSPDQINERKRTNLQERLTYIMMVYLDGLTNNKRKKLKKYLDKQLKQSVNYYMGLLKKPLRKKTKILNLTSDSVAATLNEELNKLVDSTTQHEPLTPN